MSGFFSLGGKEQHQDPETDSNNSLILFKNPQIYNKGFELWQQYYHLHQHRLLHDVDFSIGRSKTNDAAAAKDHSVGDYDSSSYCNRSGFGMMRQGRGGHEGISCQDCGNQAKKDCAHLRCRTCCKSRGFDCETHVKSTWVPAAKRRERLQALSALGGDPKRIRESTSGGGGSSLASTTLRLPSTTSGFELGQLPAEVSSPAVFRCVRVSTVDDAEEHYGYQTAVNIGGHVFKGILYDQGSDSGCQQQPLDLIASEGAASSAAAAAAATTTNNLVDPSNYPTPLCAFMAGTQFFPPPRP